MSWHEVAYKRDESMQHDTGPQPELRAWRVLAAMWPASERASRPQVSLARVSSCIPSPCTPFAPPNWQTRRWRAGLAAQAELLDQRAVALGTLAVEVAQHAAALTHHLHQAAARVEVVLVHAQVRRELLDAARENRHLHLWGASV